MKWIYVILLFLLLGIYKSLAQVSDSSLKTGKDNRTFFERYTKLSGEAGLSGELYSIAGRERRRPASSGYIFLRPTLTLLDNLNLSFDFLISTEGSSARQSLNQFALHPEWSWGKAHIGDFSHEFSQFTLSGINIRGGGVEIYPWNLRFHLVGGQTQRAVNSGPLNSSFSRYLLGLKLGYGSDESSFIDFNLVRVRDDVASLPENSLFDSTFNITPQENLVAGFNTSINLFENILKISAEAAGNIFTRDMFSREFSSEKIPSFLKQIYKVNISTNLDYAYSAQLDFDYDIFNAKAGYSIVNPGFTSLGLSSLINDRKTISFGGGVRLLEDKLLLQGNFQSQKDNLLSQKLYTTTRNNLNLTTTIRIINELNLMLGTTVNSMFNDSESDTFKIDNTNTNYLMNITSQIIYSQQPQIIVISFNSQKAKDNNILRKGRDVNVKNILISSTNNLSLNWAVNPSVSFNILDIKGVLKNTTSVYNLKVINKSFNGRLNSSVFIGYSKSENLKSTIAGFSAGFNISGADNISFNLRSSFNKGKYSSDFIEHRANLVLTHKF